MNMAVPLTLVLMACVFTTYTKVSPADHGANEKPTSGDVCPLYKDAPNLVYIAVGAAVGGIVVGCVITIIVGIIWMRRKNTNTVDDASAPDIYTSPSHYEDMEHHYGKVERQSNSVYYNTAGQHQHLDEHANTGDTTYYNTPRDADS